MSATKDKSGDEKVTLEIKLPQLLAGVVASLATAVLGSRLGVTGTLVGAAFSSLAMGLLSPFVAFGLVRSHQGIRGRVGRRASLPDAAAEDAGGTQTADATEDEAAAVLEPEVVETIPQAEVSRRLGPRAVLLGLLATALVTFALTLGVLTLFEASAGRSVDGAHGTTIQGATRPDAAAPTSASPTPSASATPSATPTPTVTPSDTPEPTPTPTPTTAPAPTTTTDAPAPTTSSAAPTLPVISATPAHATLTPTSASATATPSV